MGFGIFDTPIGSLSARTSSVGLVRLTLASEEDRSLTPSGDTITDQLGDELSGYFHRRSQTFQVPVDWSIFQATYRDILRVLLASVPYGHTTSYGQLAALAEKPRAARLIGRAMTTNPIPIVIPCHRVIRGDGSLGGYNLGGTEVKRALLDLEKLG